MSSSFSTLSASLLEIVSDILDILEQLHTASIEFTVRRENKCVIGLTVTIQCLLAEQKQGPSPELLKKIVESLEDKVLELQKQLRQTVS